MAHKNSDFLAETQRGNNLCKSDSPKTHPNIQNYLNSFFLFGKKKKKKKRKEKEKKRKGKKRKKEKKRKERKERKENLKHIQRFDLVEKDDDEQRNHKQVQSLSQ